MGKLAFNVLTAAWWALIGAGVVYFMAYKPTEVTAKREGDERVARQQAADKERETKPLVATTLRLSDSESVFLLHVRPAESDLTDRYCLVYRGPGVSQLQCWDSFLGANKSEWPALE